MADVSTIDIVLRNLVANAIKFCSANDSVSISAIVRQQLLEVSVTDTGRGMSKEVQQKLFKSAGYYSTYGTANEKGTGLGLNLCRDFVTLNCGSIWVESEPGKGSVFTFTVPLAWQPLHEKQFSRTKNPAERCGGPIAIWDPAT